MILACGLGHARGKQHLVVFLYLAPLRYLWHRLQSMRRYRVALQRLRAHTPMFFYLFVRFSMCFVRPPPSHSRPVSLGTLASWTPCFRRFRFRYHKARVATALHCNAYAHTPRIKEAKIIIAEDFKKVKVLSIFYALLQGYIQFSACIIPCCMVE